MKIYVNFSFFSQKIKKNRKKITKKQQKKILFQFFK